VHDQGSCKFSENVGFQCETEKSIIYRVKSFNRRRVLHRPDCAAVAPSSTLFAGVRSSGVGVLW
jgi:hypothetical protein